MAVAIFAASWGVKLTSDEPAAPAVVQDAPGVCGPTIDELAVIGGTVIPGGDTLAASLAIARKLRGEA
jgi:hypothetical protein